MLFCVRHPRSSLARVLFKSGLAIAAAVIASGCTKPPNAIEEGARLMAQLKAASGGAALDAPAGFLNDSDVPGGSRAELRLGLVQLPRAHVRV